MTEAMVCPTCGDVSTTVRGIQAESGRWTEPPRMSECGHRVGMRWSDEPPGFYLVKVRQTPGGAPGVARGA